MTSTPLITKYRPQEFAEMLGNELSVSKLQEAIASSARPHAFLFTGPSGTGKTTLARIVAKGVKSLATEIDAASHSGVDDVRQLVQEALFKPMTNTGKTIIIDECHGLSKPAWQALLKLIEEPPPWMTICLCTTEIQKVPDTIKTRCYHVALRALKPQEIEDLISVVAEAEQWQVSASTFQAIVQASTGQPRKALSILQAGHGAKDREELGQIIAEVERAESTVAELCSFLIRGGRNWKQISRMLAELEDDDEAMSHATAYLARALVRSEEEQASSVYKLLAAFLHASTLSYDRKICIAAALGEICYGNQVF